MCISFGTLVWAGLGAILMYPSMTTICLERFFTRNRMYASVSNGFRLALVIRPHFLELLGSTPPGSTVSAAESLVHRTSGFGCGLKI